ncbi:MAG: hypothetical protein HQL72_06845 [Magnetococcales bacterium]|nr:hypothetical protein [Magnetococcales bacterium]
MVIVLKSRDLMRRVRLSSAWKGAGHTVLERQGGERVDLIVVDLALPDAMEQIKGDRTSHPQITLLAFGPHTDEAALQEAKTAGAHQIVSQGGVVKHVLGLAKES